MRNGFKVLDTDAHQMEPAGMWQEFIDPAFADRAPAVGDYGDGRKGMMIEGEPVTNQHGAYPMDSKEFLDAAARAMERFSRTRDLGYSAEAVRTVSRWRYEPGELRGRPVSVRLTVSVEVNLY